jgi:roadblock/LC7 domain-containing protein
MDWRDVAGVVGKVAPVLGTLIGGPAGAGIGALVASALGVGADPGEVAQALALSPDAAIKLKQLEKERQVELQALLVTAEANRLTAETAAATEVNATMRAESQSERWPQWSWRPFIGFCVGLNSLAASVLVLVVFGATVAGAPQAGAAVASLPTVLGALAGISLTVMPVLGIASYFRGKAQADPTIPPTRQV